MSRKAKLIACVRCDEPVLRGLDADIAAFPARTDIYPLSLHGEVQALMAGRRTYELRLGELDHRDRWMITGRPASSITVVADHVCEEPTPADWIRPITPPAARRIDNGTF